VKFEIQSEKSIPKELIKTPEDTRIAIEMLKVLLKLQQGKYVTTTKGLRNKIKHYFLGYVHVTKQGDAYVTKEPTKFSVSFN